MSQHTLSHLISTTIAAPLGHTGAPSPLAAQCLLIVDDRSPLVGAVIEQCHQWNIRTLVLQQSQLPRAAPTIQIETLAPTLIAQTVARICQTIGNLSGILFFHTQCLAAHEQVLKEALPCLRCAIALAKAIAVKDDPHLNYFYFVTAQGGQLGVRKPASVDVLAPALEALCYPLSLEMPQTAFRSIDLDRETPLEQQVRQILGEFAQSNRLHQTAYGWYQGERWSLGFQKVPDGLLSRLTASPVIDQNTVVVLAGGARGIGSICAQALARATRCRIIFLGRTLLTDEAQVLYALAPVERQQAAEQFMQTYRCNHPHQPPRAAREQWQAQLQAVDVIETLEAIRALGAQADYYTVDVRDRPALETLIQQIRAQYQRLDVVVHIAGLGGAGADRRLSRKDWPAIDAMLETKVVGAWNLMSAARQVGASLFLAFGSIASRFGNQGQVDYASANGFLTGLVRAHNARGEKTIARVLHWGAWDGGGMAVSGTVKTILQEKGVEFISPEVGAAAFVRALTFDLTAAAPEELYISAPWLGLGELLGSAAEARARQAPLPPRQTLLGKVVAHKPAQSLQAEQWLDPKLPFLNCHRYAGIAWMPAVMGMEIAVEAAATLFPHLQPTVLQEVTLKKAVRLIRDEPILVKTDAQISHQTETETVVKVVIAAQYQQRSWVFATMLVGLSTPELLSFQEFAADQPDPSTWAIASSAPDRLTWTAAELYPCDWLPFQTYGDTFQVLKALRMNVSTGEVWGSMVATKDCDDLYLPIALIDGLLQSYGVTVSTLAGEWTGPPLCIGEIRWENGAASLTEGTLTLKLPLADPTALPVWHVFKTQGRCVLRMQRLEHRNLSPKRLVEPQQRIEPQQPLYAASLPTPYLGEILEIQPGKRLKTARTLYPQQDPLLSDHQFNQYVVVAAVHYLEIAVEAAALLLSSHTVYELQKFCFHKVLSLVKQPKTLITEAVVSGEGQVRVQFLAQSGETTQLYAEGIVVPGSVQQLTPPSSFVNPLVQARTRQGLYPHRFPHGPIFQVIEDMALLSGYCARAILRLASIPHTCIPDSACWLPMTLLDGAFQVDSATRSGFDHPSVLPKSFSRLRWLPKIQQVERVICLASTVSSLTDSPGEIWFMDETSTVLLHMEGLTLTPAFSSLWSHAS